MAIACLMPLSCLMRLFFSWTLTHSRHHITQQRNSFSLSSMVPIGRSRLALCFDKGRHCAERRLFFCGGGGRRAARGSGASCSSLEAGYHELNRVQMQRCRLTKNLAAAACAHAERGSGGGGGGGVGGANGGGASSGVWRRYDVMVCTQRAAGVAAAQGRADARVPRVPGAGRSRQAARARVPRAVRRGARRVRWRDGVALPLLGDDAARSPTGC